MPSNSDSVQPLAGVCVLVTRPAHQAASLADPLMALGASVLLQPAVEILPTDDWSAFDSAFAKLERFGRIVFVSTNAVVFFFSRVDELVREQGLATPNWNDFQFAAIGKGTAQAIRQRGVEVDLVPEKSDSAGLAALLAGHPISDSTMIIRADRGSDVLPESLSAAGYKFEQFPIYRSVDVEQADPDIVAQMAEGKIDWTTVTSSAIGHSLNALFGDHLKKTRFVTISPTTTQAIQSLGFKASVEASPHDMDGVVKAIVAYEYLK